MKPKQSKYLADCKSFLKIAEEELEYIAWDIHGKHFDPAEKMRMSCRFLDQFYQPVRYGGPERPNGGFDKEAAEKAFKSAKTIFNYVKKKVAC